MKTSKIIIAVALLVAGAAFTTVSAKKKDKAKKEEAAAAAVAAPAPAPVNLVTPADSISFAAGYANTEGLIPFLQQQYKVDTLYMADFIKGLVDAKDRQNDPQYNAYQAGGQIAKLINERMLTGIGGELEGSDTPLNNDIFYQGFIAALQKDTANYNMAKASEYFRSTMEAVHNKKAEAAKAEGAQWLAENAKKEGVVVLPSGLQYKVITAGTGEKPVATSEVEVKYEGKLIDGTVFDSSYKRTPQTTKFKANQVIKGWTEALCMMPVGSKWELYIPQDLAYGERQQGQIPAYSTLIFTVELVSITPEKAKETAPAATTSEKKTDAAKKAAPAKKATPAKKVTKK